MNLVRNIQQASLLAGIISASLFVCNNPARADQKACVITDAGTTVCGRLTNIKPPTNRPPVSSNQVQIDKITVSLKGCRRDDKIVKCTFEIANRGKEEKRIYSSVDESYVIDTSGTSYRSASIDMGGQSSASSYVRGIETSIVPGIESFASINILNVPTELTQAKVLEFNTNLGKKVQFRNVPISN
jgi:hypothetical protein